MRVRWFETSCPERRRTDARTTACGPIGTTEARQPITPGSNAAPIVNSWEQIQHPLHECGRILHHGSYCDVVATERHASHLLHSKTYQIEFGTKVVATLDDAVETIYAFCGESRCFVEGLAPSPAQA